MLYWFSEPCHVDKDRHTIVIPVFKKYLTLFHILTHFIFSLIRKINFDSCWCFDRFYYLTFLIHQNVCTDLTYMGVQFELKHLVFNCNKNVWRGRIIFFAFCNLNETFIFMSNLAWKLAHKWNMNWCSKERKVTIFHVMSQKDHKLKRKFTFDIQKFKFQNRIKQKTSNCLAFFLTNWSVGA